MISSFPETHRGAKTKWLPSRRRDPKAPAPRRGVLLLSGVVAWGRPKPGLRAQTLGTEGILNGNLMGTEWDFNGIYIIRCLWTSLLSGCFWNPMMRIINHNRDYVYQPFLQTTFCQTCFPTISMVFICKFMDIKTCWRHFWYLRYVMVSQLTPKTCW